MKRLGMSKIPCGDKRALLLLLLLLLLLVVVVVVVVVVLLLLLLLLLFSRNLTANKDFKSIQVNMYSVSHNE